MNTGIMSQSAADVQIFEILAGIAEVVPDFTPNWWKLQVEAEGEAYSNGRMASSTMGRVISPRWMKRIMPWRSITTV